MPIRRIDTDRIIHKVFIENIPRFQVADEECCSRAYITKVCNKHADTQREGQREERLVELLPDRTDKERKWAEAVSCGLSKTDAALKVYEVKDRASAKTIGQRLGADPDLVIGIQNLLHEEGLGRRYRVQKLKQVIDSKDLGITIRGLEASWKLTGENSPVVVEHVISYDPGAQRERYNELKQLLVEAIAAGNANDTSVINIDVVNND